MKHILAAVLLVAIAVLFVTPQNALAQGDTLVVYASNPLTLDQVVTRDTLGNGTRAHHVYKLVSTDTTYIFDATITLNSNATFLGVPHPTTKRPPCVQPDVLRDGSIPGVLFAFTGKKTNITLKNLYLLGIAINNTPNYGSGQAVQVSSDSVRFVADNVIFEQWSQFAIGYSGNWDKFFITNCKFRNMTTQPNQWYVGEAIRNENYLGRFPTDSLVMKFNTVFCIGGYASCPVTTAIVNFFEFTHNNVVYTFKNPLFIFNVTNAKLNDNIFYANYAGAINKTEYPWWDQLWSPEIGSVIDLDRLDLPKDSVFNPSDIGNPKLDSLSERKRNIQVRGNAYFWPTALTNFWKSWNDTAHVDSLYLPTWMNARTTNMFTDKVRWPGFVEAGNLNLDPGFGASIPNVLNPVTGNGVGLLNWFTQVRRGTGTTQLWGYNMTQVGSALNWVPPWPLPESADMMYSSTGLRNGGTDGGPVGDPNWWGVTVGVDEQPGPVPQEYSLSQNYPNPFNPSTKIDFTIPAAARVQITVYNVLGQEVAKVVNGMMTPGNHTVTFDAVKLASGVYMYKLVAGDFVSTRKMVLLK